MRRRSAPSLPVVFLILVAVALGVGAWQLAHAQSSQRADLRERFALSVRIGTATLDSLFQLINSQEQQTNARELSGPVTPDVLNQRVAAGSLYYMAILDQAGHVLAASAGIPSRVLADEASQPQFQAALASGAAAPTGFSDVLTDGPANTRLVETVVSYAGNTGRRMLVSGQPVSTFTTLLSGALQPMAPLSGGRAYVIDSKGNTLASVTPAGAASAPSRELIDSSLKRTSGTYESGVERYFVASKIPETSWRIVLSAPTAQLYKGTTGAVRWLPWMVFALSALAFAAVAVLLRRTIATSERLEISNAELGRSQARLRDRARELQRSNVELERSNADLEAFAYVASHDLSAPLRAVSGFAQLLSARYRGKLDSAADEFIGHMQSSIDHMQWIIDDLLAYSRVGRSDLVPERVDLEAVLSDVLRNLGNDIEEAGATVSHDPLPHVAGDRGQLGLVLQNLVSNAIKFAAPDVSPEVHVGAERNGAGWRISVRDNGIGIEPEQREKIFKMFQRLHDSEAYPGTGIGLAIVKRIVERHGGDIRVDPAPGGGSVFLFTVGDAPAEPGEAEPEADPLPSVGSLSASSSPE